MDHSDVILGVRDLAIRSARLRGEFPACRSVKPRAPASSTSVAGGGCGDEHNGIRRLCHSR
jgi:hypothetical protein